MTQTMIEANEIRMALGEGAGRVEALKGINLTLAGGELTLLMGPSGSGKTTLLSVLGCMLSPTSGSVNIRGRAITGLDAEGAGPAGEYRLRLSVLSSVSDADRGREFALVARCARRPFARGAREGKPGARQRRAGP